MKATVIALHGFLGQGSDWDAVRAASHAGLDWVCPDLFALGPDSFAPSTLTGPCWLAGYSFGARLALRWMQDEPGRWNGALLVSANPGNFQNDEERAARALADRTWAAHFQRQPWSELMRDWDAQKVFGGQPGPPREEALFARSKLSAAMEKFSVADQFTDPLRLPARITWLAGAHDEKFCALLGNMRDAGFPGSFLCIEDSGHRLLRTAPIAVAAALDDLVA